ncbi:MAG TPA: Gfo/Idh/MocA family oxidoreductase [Acidobacteriaceae bacterium]|jgi:predicted dehydrogenase|nr:Gfo/Idh/MocA family oxidoreductase [Acidobacteriaceae bacterium]
MNRVPLTRRDFVKISAGTAATATLLEPRGLWGMGQAASDPVKFASIGTGTRGCELLRASRQVPMAECVAIADLYDSRHDAGREAVGHDVPATRDHRSILDRKDVEAVLVAVPDHQHRRVVEDACEAGKDVYCEKPMSHNVEDGFAMVAAVAQHQRILQVGSQRVSNIVYARAREMWTSGALGDVFFIEGVSGRNSPSGAWVYPIPPDANEQTIDWKAFLVDAPERPFDAARFFRWRCFADYGEGLSGDLFVHLLSGIHFITGTNEAPQKAQSTGGLYRWKDGRDFPDLIETLYDYPNFRVALRCNLNNAQGEPITFYGTKGTMTLNGNTLTFVPQDTRPQPEGYSLIGWPERLKTQYLAQWHAEHSDVTAQTGDAVSSTYTAPQGYNDVVDHETVFFEAVRSRKAVVEDVHFGNNTAIGCHMANASYFGGSAVGWNAAKRKIEA